MKKVIKLTEMDLGKIVGKVMIDENHLKENDAEDVLIYETRIPNNLSAVDAKIKEFHSKVDDYVRNNRNDVESELDRKIADVKAKFQPRLDFWRDRLNRDKMAKKRSWLINPTFSIVSYKPGNTEFYRASYRLNLPGEPNLSAVVHIGPVSNFPEGPESQQLKNLAKLNIIKAVRKKYPGYYEEMGIPTDPQRILELSESVVTELRNKEEYNNKNFSKVQAQYAAEMRELENEKTSLANETKVFSILKPNITLTLYDPTKTGTSYIRASFRHLNPYTGKSEARVVHVAQESLYPDWETNPEVRTLAEIKVLITMLEKYPEIFEEFFEETDFDF